MSGDVLGGRYELRGLLGHGGMARVFEAWDRTLERRVAVKLLRDDVAGDPVARERLLREAPVRGPRPRRRHGRQRGSCRCATWRRRHATRRRRGPATSPD